jgi:hypothetical protein
MALYDSGCPRYLAGTLAFLEEYLNEKNIAGTGRGSDHGALSIDQSVRDGG